MSYILAKAARTGGVENALTELPARKPPVIRSLDDMARKVTGACASLTSAIREVLDDRFWQ
jgi:hypothetical protein